MYLDGVRSRVLRSDVVGVSQESSGKFDQQFVSKIGVGHAALIETQKQH